MGWCCNSNRFREELACIVGVSFAVLNLLTNVLQIGFSGLGGYVFYIDFWNGLDEFLE